MSLKSDNYSFDCEALLLPGNGANVGLVTYYNGKFEAYQRTYVLNDFIKIFPKYVEKSLNARFLKSIEGKQYGSAINYIKIGNLLDFIISLPPLAEQKLIVTKVNQLMQLCDQLDACQKKASTKYISLNDAALEKLLSAKTIEEFAEHWQFICNNFDLIYNDSAHVNKLRQAILQLAVQGKLAPQDPNDEPAGELLKRIKAEKEKLIAEGKIKKQKPLPLITEDKIPYELPNGWEWVRLGELGEINPRINVDNDEMDVSFIPMKMISEKYGKRHSFERKKWAEVKKGFTYFMDSDVGLAKITPCFENGKSTVFKGLLNGVGAGTTELHIFRQDPELILPEYVLIFFKCSKFLNDAKEKMTGTAGQKRVPRDFVRFVPFPLPSISEQKRIVAKVDQLMNLCDKLETRLNQSKKDSEMLMQIVLQKALEAQ
jgi:type I restriction enzyme S subunit